jgi:protein required for attachment to host cells
MYSLIMVIAPKHVGAVHHHHHHQVHEELGVFPVP